MDFGGGLAVGIAAGIGSGLAMGVSSGRKQAKDEFRDYMANNNITVHDGSGKPIKLEEFLEVVCDDAIACNSRHKKWALASLILALGFAVAAGVAVYFLS